MVTISTILLGLLSGFVGWILSEFLAKPIRRGIDLAAKAKALFIEHANVSARVNEQGDLTDLNDQEEERLSKAVADFRRVAAELYAFAQTDLAAGWLLTKTMFDVEWAATAMMQLSNNFETYGRDRRECIEIAIKALKVTPLAKK
ncbi:MAG: hypothetical protein WBF99_12380 [Xanthobacteraceae bacterium]